MNERKVRNEGKHKGESAHLLGDLPGMEEDRKDLRSRKEGR
jgi:hypothetical protein